MSSLRKFQNRTAVPPKSRNSTSLEFRKTLEKLLEMIKASVENSGGTGRMCLQQTNSSELEANALRTGLRFLRSSVRIWCLTIHHVHQNTRWSNKFTSLEDILKKSLQRLLRFKDEAKIGHQ